MKPPYQDTLEKIAVPAPDPQARLRARHAALAEFSRVNETAPSRPGFLQGLLATLRLSRDIFSRGSKVMAWSTNTRMLAGAASVCIAVVGLAVVWPMIRNDGGAHLLEPRGDATWEPGIAQTDTPTPAPELMGAAPSVGGEVVDAPLPQPSAGAAPDAARVKHLAPQRNEARPPAEPVNKDDRGAGQPDLIHADNRLAADAVALPEQKSAEALQSAMTDQPAVAFVVPPRLEETEEVMVTGTRAQRRAGSPKAAAPPPPATTGVGSRGFIDHKREDERRMPAADPAHDGRDKFTHFEVNAVKQVSAEPVSTFSADVDTTSYSFVRKQLNAGMLPQKDAVRVEEMINYFDYSWPAPESRDQPFEPTVVVSSSPWGEGRKLVHIGIKGYELPAQRRPDVNLVMLIDVSGSMNEPDKLPLVRESMRLLLGSLKPTDTVAIVVYAGAAGTVLPPTRVGEKEKILEALGNLRAGGSTAGAAGIRLAYQLAESSFRKDGVNRILLATDGDFNVGVSSTEELKGLVERKRETGVFLSVLGFGSGNYRDEMAQALAQNGNGVAAYIDTLQEAQKVLVQQAGSSLFTIASDVKLQVEFNPGTVAEYRLVGYETRALKREDFNNDAVDAGDVGAGHTVTAIYEITPVGADARMVEPSRYVPEAAPRSATGKASEYGFLKIRYKLPGERKSRLIEQAIPLATPRVAEPIANDVRFSTAVAGFAQLLRGGTYTGGLSYEDLIAEALATRGDDPFGYRSEFVQLVRKAQAARP